jgi:hypothetical protein
MDHVENTAPHCCSSVVSKGTYFFAKSLLSIYSCIFAYRGYYLATGLHGAIHICLSMSLSPTSKPVDGFSWNL